MNEETEVETYNEWQSRDGQLFKCITDSRMDIEAKEMGCKLIREGVVCHK